MQKVKQFVFEKKELCLRSAVALAVVLAMTVLLAVTVFADTTYFIYDGDRQLIHKTDAEAPADVLEEAGLELSADDLITTEEGFNTATITIRRAVDISINYYGEPKNVVAYEDETLAQVLERLELSWNEGDTLSQSLDTLAYDGLNLAISTVVVEEQTYTAAIAYETVYVDDHNMKKGATKVRTEGVEGEKLCTASVTYINGVETARQILNEEVTTEAVDKVVAVGTGKNLVMSAGNVTIGNGTITLASGEVLTYTRAETFKATAYTSTDPGCGTKTATGTTVRVGTVAVDPRVIPYGTRMFIVTNDGAYIYGVGTAEDCGGAIKGNRLDLYFPTHSQCISFGVRNCTVYFLG